MKIINRNISFKSGFVYITDENNGKEIKQIVKKFNAEFVPPKESISNEINYIIPAGGSGSRLKALTRLLGNYNKVSFPFYINKDESFSMLDFPMALGKNLIDKNGYKIYSDKSPNGNFAPIIEHYLQNPNDKRPIVSIGADAVVDMTSEEFMKKIKSNIENNVNINLFGIYKTPEEVADKFGVFTIDENEMGLTSYIEKPPIEIANKLALYNSKNIANTGIVYFSRKAIQKILDRVIYEKENPTAPKLLAKNKKEIYNTANAMDYLFTNYEELFDEPLVTSVKVRLIPSWEDIGICKTYIEFLKKVQTGQFLQNFSKEKSEKIINAVKNRLGIINGENYLLLSKNKQSLSNLTQQDIQNAKRIENYNIII